MRRLRATKDSGFTTIEVLIVIIVISLLATLTLNLIGGAQGRGRDEQRAADLDTLHSRLEEYFSDNGGYPNTLNASLFPGIDDEVLKDPAQVNIVIASASSNQYAALAVSNPTAAANYKYIPYPTGCGLITCTGYVLKSYIELPDTNKPNPYVLYGLNNN
jgi:prepilin-type N-terminal cleavage/methylation domain-containing protein